MAHKKGQGSTKNGRDSNPQYRGIKLYGGELAKAGAIIVRQCGPRLKAGHLVRRGNADTLYATEPGPVSFPSRYTALAPSPPGVPPRPRPDPPPAVPHPAPQYGEPTQSDPDETGSVPPDHGRDVSND